MAIIAISSIVMAAAAAIAGYAAYEFGDDIGKSIEGLFNDIGKNIGKDDPKGTGSKSEPVGNLINSAETYNPDKPKEEETPHISENDPFYMTPSQIEAERESQYGNEQKSNNDNQKDIIPPLDPNKNNTDETGTQFGETIGTMDYNSIFDWITKERDERWAREDAIRKETQAREDNAYERAISSLKRAGVNVNLLGSISPADSGGGITTASGLNMELYKGELERNLLELEKMIEQSFKGDENEKDRVVEIIGKIITYFGMGTLAKSR